MKKKSKNFLARHKAFFKDCLYILAFCAAFFIALIALSLFESKASPPYVYGVTYQYPYAQALGLDWRKTYQNIFTDLNIKYVRLPVYYDKIEPQKGEFNFSELDYEMSLAQQQNAHVILVVGRRVPGWPECHIPDWTQNYSWDQRQQYLSDEITLVVNRYKNNPALQMWQVENEPFLTRFGKCPAYDNVDYLDQEIALVRSLDPQHAILTTDSGELSVWVRAAKRGDVFGSTLYRKVYADSFHRYINYHWPPIFFRIKRGFVHLFYPNKPIINIELQAEPWTTKGMINTSFDEMAITLPPGQLTQNVQFAHDSGFGTTYLWGVEYWYWAATKGHPEFLQEAKNILK